MMIQVRFAGIGCIGSFNFSLRHGVTPSTGSIAFPVNFTPPLVGNLLISDGFTSIVFGEMYLINPVRSQSESGDIIQATIADKRVCWQFGQVTGEYNIPDESTGKPRENVLLTELLSLIFAVYAEFPIYIDIPIVYPAVSWDHVNPATAAQELMSKYGLSLSLDSNGAIYISPANHIRFFPPGWFMSRELTNLAKPYPSYIRIIGNRIINQNNFVLTPVGVEINGLDPDGTIKAINDLSYTPSAGWGKSYLRYYTDVKTEFGEDEYELALKCIYRWYAYIPSDDGYDKREYCLPWLGHIKNVMKVPNTILDDEEQRDRPFVKVDQVQRDGISGQNQGALKETEQSYSIDYARGIVKFTDEVVRMVAGTAEFEFVEAQGAAVTITAAYEKKHGDVNDFYHYDLFLGGSLPPLVHRDHSLTLFALNLTEDATQKVQLDAFAHSIAVKLAEQYFNVNPEQRVYAGLLPIIPYGEFKSVTWNLSESGVNTVVSKGVEEIRPFLPSFQERALQKKTVSLHWPSESMLDRGRQQSDENRRGGVL